MPQQSRIVAPIPQAVEPTAVQRHLPLVDRKSSLYPVASPEGEGGGRRDQADAVATVRFSGNVTVPGWAIAA